MGLPAALETTLVESMGKVLEVVPIGGGDISQAARVRSADGVEVLVTWRSGPPTGLFTAERRGLDLLRSPGALRVPQVFDQREAAGPCPAYIVMEWLGQSSTTPQVAEALGRGLAAMHRTTAETYGLDHDNFIGANPQSNRQTTNWVTFFGEQRLGFQMELAAKNGYLPRQRAERLEKLLARLDQWLPTSPPASLLHGDLWGGNWLTTASGDPALIDPAVYYGDRETDLAFTELFGGFSSAFYAAYNDSWPLDPGYNERKDLYNLYHLLNHLNLFGHSYGGSVDRVLPRYGR
ncbi:MAG: fructosamine kinase family protein [Anaerolineales bacterium]|nr:fructosamine kinase family protein [Anaerolineales bacterium]